MISLDQVLLLEEKVESAVEKIKQLEAENAALRNKCSELTNALSTKTEQLTSLETDQKKIESGIIKAIDRLNSIENSVLKSAGQSAPKQAAPAPQPAPAQAPVEPTPAPAAPVEEPAPAEPEISEEQELDVQEMNFDSMETVEEPVEEEEIQEEAPDVEDPESRDELGFDIF